jgi:hypothetical protein
MEKCNFCNKESEKNNLMLYRVHKKDGTYYSDFVFCIEPAQCKEKFYNFYYNYDLTFGLPSVFKGNWCPPREKKCVECHQTPAVLVKINEKKYNNTYCANSECFRINRIKFPKREHHIRKRQTANV